MIGVRRRSGAVCVFARAEEAREGEDREQRGERRWGIDAVAAARATLRSRRRHRVADPTQLCMNTLSFEGCDCSTFNIQHLTINYTTTK